VGLVEQTSPAPHIDDITAAAASLAAGGAIPLDKTRREAEALGVPYQQAGLVRQLLAERANALAYGNKDRVTGIDSSLDALGYTGDRTVGASGTPVGRSSRPEDKAVRTDAPSADSPKRA
jgi:hypothetical protein